MNANALAEIHALFSKPEYAPLEDCRLRIENWLADSCIDLESKEVVVRLLKEQRIAELRDSFYRELEFGTGGLRGIIGSGNNRMNRYVVRRATQGLANYIKKQGPEAMRRGVAIAHDSRRFSDVFAREAASVLAANGIQAHLFPELNTTPCLSFSVRKLGCISGICVTASHNPPEYNGFKVYWEDGAQIVPPVDAGVLDEVFAVRTFAEAKYLAFEEGRKAGLVHFIDQSVVEAWYEAIDGLRVQKTPPAPLKIVYTPLHGTGAKHARATLRRWGFEAVHVVPEQEKPDGEFPTVKKPNPEEPEALKLAIAQAEAQGADVVLATDPDSDRLALVVREPELSKTLLKHQAVGNYVLLNGNQTGAIMIDFLLSGLKAQGRLKPQHQVVKTIVTSELHARICAKYGVGVHDTLTGFKWIAGLVREWETTKRTDLEYLFGTEESFGYMPGPYVRDKDGIGALCMAAEMASVLKAGGKTAGARLLEIFKEHGAWQESLINVDLVGEEGAARIRRMMAAMRNSPRTSFSGVAVRRVFDYKTGEVQMRGDDGKFTPAPQRLTLPPSDVLQFELMDGSRISMRPSGTEPKIKFYISVCTPVRGDVADAYRETLSRIEGLNAEIREFVGTVQ